MIIYLKSRVPAISQIIDKKHEWRKHSEIKFKSNLFCGGHDDLIH